MNSYHKPKLLAADTSLTQTGLEQQQSPMSMVKNHAGGVSDTMANAYALQEHLTDEALTKSESFLQRLKPNEQSKVIQKMQAEIVENNLRHTAQILDYLNQAEYKAAVTYVDAMLLDFESKTRSAAYMTFFYGYAELGRQFSMIWKSFLQSAHEELTWASGLHPMLAELATEKVKRTATSISKMMGQLQANYETITPEE